jgi:hypothetical protein
MTFEIIPYTAEYESAVKEFNQRLLAAGTKSRFPESSIPKWLPNVESRKIFQEFYLCLERDIVRGGYILKRQVFQLRGGRASIGNFQLPLSEGIIDRKFSMIGLTLLRDALKKEARLFSLGLGGYEEPLTKLLKSSGWEMASVPFHFKIISAYRFLRKIRFLRKTQLRRMALDLAAFTGVGWLAIKIAQMRRNVSLSGEYHTDEVRSFQGWADKIWDTCRDNYLLQAVRDQETLQVLYAESDPRFHRLVVLQKENPVGWCVVMATHMKDHKHFGGLHVGTIVDLLCTPQSAGYLVRSSTELLRQLGCDLIVTNQSSAVLGAAFGKSGYLKGPSNFILAVSPELAKDVSPFESNLSKFHFNRGDGDGPIHL